jgi:WD40 repeat protein
MKISRNEDPRVFPQVLRVIKEHTGAIYKLISGPDKNQFFSASGDGLIALWNIASDDEPVLVFRCSEPVYTILYLHHKNELIAGCQSGDMHVFSLSDRKQIRHIQAHTKGLFCIASLPEENLIWTAGGDGIVHVWCADNFNLIKNRHVCSTKTRHIHAGKKIRISCGDGHVRMIEPVNLETQQMIFTHGKGCSISADHPLKPVWLSGGRDGYIRVYSHDDNSEILALPAHKGTVYGLHFHKEGKILVSHGTDKTIAIWNSANMELLHRIEAGASAHTHSVNTALWLNDILISGGDDRKIILWEIFETHT